MKAVRVLCAAAACSAASVQAFSTAGTRRGMPRAFGLATTSTSRSSTIIGGSTRLMSSVSPGDFIKKEVGDNKVVIFSKSYCPFCTSTKSLFEGLGVEAKIYELDEMEDGADIQAALAELSGQRTVPNTFVGGKHLGGNDDAQKAAKAGKLQELLGV